MVEKNYHEFYVPRHERLGVTSPIQKNEPSCHEIEVEIPITDDDGNVIASQVVVECVPVNESMSKYNLKDFKLDNLLRAGVKLSEINVNFGSLDFQDVVLSRAKALNVVADVADRVATQKQLVEKSIVESINSNENE